MIEIRTGQAPAPLKRAEFGERFRASYIDPAFRAEEAALARLEVIAWQAYDEGRKAPFTQAAGSGYADPSYQLSSEWLATKRAWMPRNGCGPIKRHHRACCWCAARRVTTAAAPAKCPRAFAWWSWLGVF